jgi:hypothetical protein
MQFLGTVQQENLIFFLDKIIYPNTLDEIMKMLKKFCPKNINLKFSAVLPIIEAPYSCYPFSLSMLFDCIERVISRKGHETLYGDPKLIASVIIRCFHQYKSITFNEEFLHSKNINSFIKIPFVLEIDNFAGKLGPELINELNSIFKEHQPGQII